MCVCLCTKLQVSSTILTSFRPPTPPTSKQTPNTHPDLGWKRGCVQPGTQKKVVQLSQLFGLSLISTHSTWCKTFTFSRISEWIWICYITNHWISHNISCFLTKLVLNCPLSFLQCFTLFMAPILLGNKQKIGLKMKTKFDVSRRYG